MPYKFVSHDRNYSSYDYYDSDSLTKVELEIDAATNKLLDQDIFTMNDGVNIIHSVCRNTKNISGVLILDTNKTYGKNAKGKTYHKCIPDDMRLPGFLIAYNNKFSLQNFYKSASNKYVTFVFKSWQDKHPVGELVQTIGNVEELPAFYEYMLYCKSLNASMSNFNTTAVKSLTIKKDKYNKILKLNGNKNEDYYINQKYIPDILRDNPDIEDRTEYSFSREIPNCFAYTIDPKNSTDFDDAFSIYQTDRDNIILSIYITDVPIWLDYLNLWNSLTDRVATIYLPDRKRPMLPTILSDNLCSLKQKYKKFAIALDIHIKYDLVTNEIVKTSYEFNRVLINIKKNYVYEEPALLKSFDYKQLYRLVIKMNATTHKYQNKITNSHDVINYLMTLFNHCAAGRLHYNQYGIYRSATLKQVDYDYDSNIKTKLPDDVSSFLSIWKNASGIYNKYSSDKGDNKHEVLGLENYCHASSPIRRLVDLLNITCLEITIIPNSSSIKSYGLPFYESWVGRLDYVNTAMRSIRKIQCDCNILHLCNTNPSITTDEHKGYIFDKILRDDSLFQYMVYIPRLKLLSRVTCREDKENYSCADFKIYLFNDEYNMKRKVRLQIVNGSD